MCSLSNINLSNISSNDLYSVLNIIILNKNINSGGGATEICFELFQRLFSTHFKTETSNQDNVNVEQLSQYLQQLISQNKFSREVFCELLFSELNDVPLKLVAWLDENNIYFFAQYCMNNSTSNISNQLINLIESNAKHESSYIFMKILISVYNIGITNTSKLFTIKCRKILDIFLNSSLIEFEKEDPKLINILLIINELDSLLYGQVIQQFTKQILQNLLICKDIVTLHDAFLMQELWTRIPDKLLIIYYELIKLYSLEDLLELINSTSERNLNWKFALILISVFVKKNPDSFKQLKDLVNRKLQSLFSDQMKTVDANNLKPSTELLSCIIFIRQICYAQDNPQLSYSDWYSNTFGPNTNLRTGSDSNAFSLFLATLTSIINKEPISVLRTHIERSIRTPSGRQGDMLVFKDVCRIQLSRIIQSEQINIKNCNFPVIVLLEEGLNRFDSIWALRQPDICKSLLPYIINDSKYGRLKEMVLRNGLINENDLLGCKKLEIMENDVSIIDESDVEMFADL